MDPASSAQVGLYGLLGIVVSSITIVIVAFINSRRERGGTAASAVESVIESDLERTLRERLALKDEQIADRDADLARKERVIAIRDAKIEILQTELKEARNGHSHH